jgi:hypothetical protein
MRTYYRGSRVQRTDPAAREAAVLRQEHGAICTHDHVTPALRLNPRLDNAARDEIQKAGQAACKVRQLAEWTADPPTTAPDATTGT